MTVSLKTKNAYSEVFELMKYIDRRDLDKIPMEIFLAIKENRNEDYVPKIDFENIKQSLSKEARALYIGLYKKYMIQDKNEVQAINKILYENEIKKNENAKYDIFNKTNVNQKNVTEDEMEKNKALVVFEESFIKRIINKLKEIFINGGKKGGN